MTEKNEDHKNSQRFEKIEKYVSFVRSLITIVGLPALAVILFQLLQIKDSANKETISMLQEQIASKDEQIKAIYEQLEVKESNISLLKDQVQNFEKMSGPNLLPFLNDQKVRNSNLLLYITALHQQLKDCKIKINNVFDPKMEKEYFLDSTKIKEVEKYIQEKKLIPINSYDFCTGGGGCHIGHYSYQIQMDTITLSQKLEAYFKEKGL